MFERVDRAYLERRLELCREKAVETDDPGLARVYRNFADQYARALAAEFGGQAGSEEPVPPFMLQR
ncbi:hypothetical protein Q9Q95_09820 [Sphingomonas sp. DG1-23]|jgi:hypothetical protein|uniref:hypothetical protein n=1 Tax=Sphingomonas sp. DG1-23 TaxID=3068316 RepID=UPI00273D0027|nr:hypothetical protein [Sphingomonas sp. DG1-23]MDP5279218.1 hypothetical protein [Sphingomonas sp. DG1-23]